MRGGDLVRALEVGDVLQMKTNHRVYEWDALLSLLQVEVFHAV